MKKVNIYAIFALLTGVIVSCAFYRVTPDEFLMHVSRIIFSRSMAIVHYKDMESVRKSSVGYYVGINTLPDTSSAESWRSIAKQNRSFRFADESKKVNITYDIPFVYEDTDMPDLVELRNRYQLDSIIKEGADEYDSMLRLAAWVGTRWDHGIDVVPGGTKVCDPIEVIRAGEGGGKFWCEIAARLMVRSATAVGWPARLVTASRDGYTWEHAIAELWSNQHQKWFVVDTDFNVVYEANNVPLSAFELCHEGVELQRKEILKARFFAPLKQSLTLQDLIPYYRYVHIDMRNDWCARDLRRGSPAGGDLATWWTARTEMGKILTAKKEVGDKQIFDWPVNGVEIYCLSAEQVKEGMSIEVGLMGYSPYFKHFEIADNSEPWRTTQSGRFSFTALTGQHTIKARIVTANGNKGPVSEVRFFLEQVEVSRVYSLKPVFSGNYAAVSVAM